MNRNRIIRSLPFYFLVGIEFYTVLDALIRNLQLNLNHWLGLVSVVLCLLSYFIREYIFTYLFLIVLFLGCAKIFAFTYTFFIIKFGIGISHSQIAKSEGIVIVPFSLLILFAILNWKSIFDPKLG